MRKHIFFLLLLGSICSFSSSQNPDLPTIQIGGFAGLDTQSDTLLAEPNNAVLSQNTLTDTNRTLTKSFGFSTYTAISDSYSSGEIKSMYNFKNSNGNDYIALQREDTLYLTKADGSYTMVATSFSAVDKMRFSVLNDYLWITNGSDYLRYVNETGTDGQVNTIIAKLSAVHHGTLWVGNTKDSPSEVRYCDFNEKGAIDPTNTANWSDVLSFYINPSDGGSITGLISFQGKLIVFKENGIYGILGYTVDDFQVIQYSKEAGCIDDGTIQENNGELIFMSKKGLMSFDGQNLKALTNKIRNDINNLDNIVGEEYRWLQTSINDFSINTSSTNIEEYSADIKLKEKDYTWNNMMSTGSYMYQTSTGNSIGLSLSNIVTEEEITLTNEMISSAGGSFNVAYMSNPILTEGQFGTYLINCYNIAFNQSFGQDTNLKNWAIKTGDYESSSTKLISGTNPIYGTPVAARGYFGFSIQNITTTEQNKLKKIEIKVSPGMKTNPLIIGETNGTVNNLSERTLDYATFTNPDTINTLITGIGTLGSGQATTITKTLNLGQYFYISNRGMNETTLSELLDSKSPKEKSLSLWTSDNQWYCPNISNSYNTNTGLITIDNINKIVTQLHFKIFSGRTSIFSSIDSGLKGLTFDVYDIKLYKNGSQQVYNSSGTYISDVYDTGITVPTYGMFDAQISTNQYTNEFTMTVQSSSDNITWNSSVLVSTHTNLSETSLTRQRYLRWQVTMQSSSNTYTPSVNQVDVEVCHSTGQFISRKFNPGSNVFSYTRFITSHEQTPTLLNGTTIYLQWATTSTGLDSATYYQVPVSSALSIASSNQWIRYKIDLYSSNYSSRPIVNSTLLLWNEGGTDYPMSSIVYDGRYYLACNDNGSYNNTIYVLDKNNNIHKWTGYNANCFAIYKNSLYFGLSTSGTLAKMEENITQLGTTKTMSYWKTPELLLGKIDKDKKDIELYLSGKSNSNSTVDLEWYIDGETNARNNFTLSLSTPTGLVRHRITIPIENNSNIRTCALKIKATEQFNLYNISIYNKEHSLR